MSELERELDRLARNVGKVAANPEMLATVRSVSEADPMAAQVDVAGEMRPCRLDPGWLIEIGQLIYVVRDQARPGSYTMTKPALGSGTGGALLFSEDSGIPGLGDGQGSVPTPRRQPGPIITLGDSVEDIVSLVGDPGDSVQAAHLDHAHAHGPLPVAGFAPGQPHEGYTQPGDDILPIDDTTTAPGTSVQAAREDHVHAHGALPTSGWSVGEPHAGYTKPGDSVQPLGMTNAAGASALASRQDHVHAHGSIAGAPSALHPGFPSLGGDIQTIATANAPGDSTDAARDDHVHAHGAIAGLPAAVHPDLASATHTHPAQREVAHQSIAVPDDVTTTFATAVAFTANTLIVRWNGLTLMPGLEYAEGGDHASFSFLNGIVPLKSKADTVVVSYTKAV